MHKNSCRSARWAVTLLAISIWTVPARAQEDTASITGQVLDPTGAGIAGAKVVARNVQTGIERSTITGDTEIGRASCRERV